MDDYQLSRFCERNPDCGCRCMSCPAFAQNQRDELGYEDDDYDWDDDWDDDGYGTQW